MSEEKIIRELRANGPCLLDFMAGAEFQTYKKGVLTERENPDSIQMYSENEKDSIFMEQLDSEGISDRSYFDYKL